ncbi:rubrerythrin, partial [Escherichia coli]|nr:rubrerythrin [Escherichia coli]
MHGEAYANLKYLRYADQAQAAGKPELAKLFRASANVEANEHFDREAQALRLGSSN